MTVTVNYYLISFLAVTFDRPYLDVATSSLAEMLAYATSGLLFRCLGPKASLFFSLALSSVAGFLLLIMSARQDYVFTGLAMLCKFGISGTYNIQLCTLPLVFQSEFLATGFGIAHFFAVLFQMSTPFIATIAEPIPVVFFASLAAFGAICSLLLKPFAKAQNLAQ